MGAWPLVAVAAALGLLCGSFTNVLIARIPSGMDWVKDSSRCPNCQHAIAWYDNIPVLSWLWLGRRCRHCRRPISARYPLVELIVAAMFALVALQFGLSILAVLLAYLVVISVALVAIDLEHQRLPDKLVLPSIVVSAVALLAYTWVEGEWWILARAILGALILGGFYFAMWFAYPKGLGFGDVKTGVLFGLVLGALGWSTLAVGAIAGPLLGAVGAVIAIARHRSVKGVRLAYGPALIGGAWVGILAGDAIAQWYIDWALSWGG
ncbi:prepilin peptidase [Demequina oxidasica]|uniref:prepilin peptidase n=1 Tax=Demequina oxidasica TaxID=676199 RepID=UPI000784891E|nr:A24 family peptidase [Demequina oxidasica]